MDNIIGGNLYDGEVPVIYNEGDFIISKEQYKKIKNILANEETLIGSISNGIYRNAVIKSLLDMGNENELVKEMILKYYDVVLSVWNYELNVEHFALEVQKLHDRMI